MLLEVAKLFLKLGFTAFGGPAAHVAMFHDEVVKRRKWIDDTQFLDLLGATNLIPGPNSTEMAIHLGYLRAGWAGLLMGGVCFILPAMLIVLALSWAYVRFGSAPQVEWLLYGIKPVVIAIVFQALWSLGIKAIKSPITAAAGLVALVLDIFGGNPLLALFAGGLLVMLGANLQRLARSASPGVWIAVGWAALVPKTLPALAPQPFSLGVLFLTFLKIGSVLYGSGYVLLAFLRAEFIDRLGWLTDQQLIDAIALGQITPGPVFTSATFIGYLLGGVPGGLAATLGIFLPSFVLVAISNPFIPRLRRSPWAAGLLDGVNAASLGLMAAVTWQLGRTSLVDPLTIALGILAALLLFRFKTNTTWLILGGGLAGLVQAILRGAVRF